MTTFFLTILADLTIAVAVGMVLASFLFMKRVGEISKIAPLNVLQKILQKFGIIQEVGASHVFSHFDQALAYATKIVETKT